MDRTLRCITALAIVLFPLLTAGDADVCNCLDVSLDNRVSCGGPGIPFEQCKAMGCCYDARFSEKPFCYVNAIKEEQTVATMNQDLKENGGRKLMTTKEREQKEMEDLCEKCHHGNDGILGLVGNVLGTSRPGDCKKCMKSKKIFKRTAKKSRKEKKPANPYGPDVKNVKIKKGQLHREETPLEVPKKDQQVISPVEEPAVTPTP